jgi:N-acyl homoserine lactone hydrolase
MHVGQCALGEHHLLGDPHSDDQRIEFTLYSFLVDGGPGRRILVDLGPVGIPYINWMFRRYSFFRDLPGSPDDVHQPHGNVFDWLDRLGWTPESVDHVILTHLHADHHALTDGKDGGGLLRFSRARIHVSRIGWAENLEKRVNGRWHSYVDYAFSDFLLEAERDGRLVLQDEDEAVPGVRVAHLGGHSVCSRAVCVDTVSGPAVICSDEVYRYDLLERAIMARLRVTHARLVAATERLADMAEVGAILLPCHEPALFEAYQQHGDAWLQHVKPLSERAVAGFRDSVKRLIGETSNGAPQAIEPVACNGPPLP